MVMEIFNCKHLPILSKGKANEGTNAAAWLREGGNRVCWVGNNENHAREARLARPGIGNKGGREGEMISRWRFRTSEGEIDDELRCTRIKLGEWLWQPLLIK